VSDVVLVSMPFGPVFSPSLGLSLLKAALARQGVVASVRYFTIRFAEAVGQNFYCGIAENGRPAVEDLAGEWLFNRALFDMTAADDRRYVEQLLRGYYSDALIARLLHARELVDAFLDDCLDCILREQPRLVGFTSIFQQHVASLALARRVKRAQPSTFIVFGGANCEGVMGAETVRCFPFVDAAVSGDGDLVFPELVRRVLHGELVSPLPGIRSRDSVEHDFATGGFGNAAMVTDMGCLPYPDYSDYFEQFGASRYDREWQPRLFLETARGCWWGERAHCTFCGLNGSTMAFRSKPAARALAEVEDLVKRYPGCDIQVVDNILDMRYFKDFIPALAARNLKVSFYYESKSNLNKQQVRLLRAARINEIQPGIESLSDAVLKLMRKGVTGLQNVQLLKWCKELGVDARWNFLWGFPGEAPDEYTRLAGVVPLLTHLQPPRCYSTIRLDRFSPNFFDAEQLGFTDVQPLAAYHHVYRLPEAALTNLGCYFTYRYREPRDVEGYVRPLVREIDKWKRVKNHADVMSVEAGEFLVIVDLRPVSRTPFVLLGGLERTLYRECDAVRDLWQLARTIAAAEDADTSTNVEQLLAPLVEHGLLLRDGSRYLALAVPIGEYVPPRPVIHEFSRVVRKLGTPGGRGWIVPVTRIGKVNGRSSAKEGAWAGRAARVYRASRAPVPRLTACHFSIDARGRLAIQASARSTQTRRSC
jgi:ribosomal peptide maturation radical SAM protein 1